MQSSTDWSKVPEEMRRRIELHVQDVQDGLFACGSGLLPHEEEKEATVHPAPYTTTNQVAA